VQHSARCCVWLLSLLSAAACATADEQAQTLLRDMHEATRELNYDGIFVYQRGAQIETMRLVHMNDAGTVHERLISLSGPAREVIRDGTRVTCLYADGAAATEKKGRPHGLVSIGFSAPIETLLANYRFVLEGNDRIAGRATQVIGVMPHHDDRYGYRLWVDDSSKLLLKSMILGRGGRVLEQMQFAAITLLDDHDPGLLQPEIAGNGFTWRTDPEDGDAAVSGQQTGWQAHWLPVGFELEETNIQTVATNPTPVGQLVYSDGLAMVSVFIEELMHDDVPLQGYSARGAVNAFSRVDDKHQITVVGELPLPTVRQIAASISRVE
jgi:sigma-E factor negative regulatory protein RseB